MKFSPSYFRIPLELQFRHMPKSRKIHQMIQQHLERFAAFVAPAARCAVVIDESRHCQKGGVYDVSVRLSVPGERLYTARISETSGSCDILYGVLNSAFDDIKRQLIKARARRQRRHRAVLLPCYA